MEKNFEILPSHIAIIPDANRRWAKERELNPWEGHEAGARNMEELIKHALRRKIKCLSFWGSSVDNLKKRPIEEKMALLDIYERYLGRLMESQEIHQEETRVNFIGRWEEQFPESLKKIIRELAERTKHYKKRMLNFFLAYNGDDEMLLAISKILEKYERGQEITADILKANLMTRELPPVDYLIRTGGEPHLSAGFMMWDIADAQLFFSEKKFPDFGPESFDEALAEFERRERRFGK
ncbi:MAG: polyprenyl diphosphate synthase [Patescibacteria group bacterium]